MIAVIGGGLSGLSAAIRLAEQGAGVELFEAAPELGGRTRSFFEPAINELCDNGPHLLAGACRDTQRLLQDCGASDNIHWQRTLELPLWDNQRGFFRFQPTSLLPVPFAMMLAALKLPGHGPASALAMLKLGRALHSDTQSDPLTVRDWLAQLRTPAEFKRDFLEPLCLGAMNESMETASAASFRRVLSESFDSHEHARLGWFSRPITEALIAPLANRALQLGVTIHKRRRVRCLSATNDSVRVDAQLFDAAVLALPAYAANRLLGLDTRCETRAITNLHLWFDEDIRLPAIMVGGIGTKGQWFFDVSAQMSKRSARFRHICIVISADTDETEHSALVRQLVAELKAISGLATLPPPVHSRLVREKRATVLVRPGNHQPSLPPGLIDACERPLPGDLPATIETAIRRGEKAAKTVMDDSI